MKDGEIQAADGRGGNALSAPEMLPPQPLPALAPLAVATAMVTATIGIGAFFLVAGGGDSQTPGTSTTGSRGDVIAIAAHRATGAFPILPDSIQNSPAGVLKQLAMPEAEKQRLAEKLADRSVRLAAVTLWDTMDEDGDLVELSAAGFSQRLVILHKPRMFFLPVQPGGVVTIKAISDGGGGGVTLGLQTVLGTLPLPPLAPGQSVEIPAL